MILIRDFDLDKFHQSHCLSIPIYVYVFEIITTKFSESW